MQLKARVILTLLTAVGIFVSALVGGWFGPVLSWWWFVLLVVFAFFFVLPWSPVTWSQEDIKEQMEAFLKATDELQSLRSEIVQMSEELKESGGMSLEEVQQFGERFEQKRAPSLESMQTLRELLFATHRRMVVVQLLVMFFIAVGGSLLAHRFYIWFSH